MRFLGSLTLSVCAAALLCAGSSTPRREDVPKYMKMLTSGIGKDRAKAAEMLGRRGAISRKDVEDAIEPLKKMLQNDKDSGARSAAALALGAIAPTPDETVPLLIDALKDKSVDVKISAISALGLYGPAAKSAVTPLREIQKDKTDKKMSQAAGMALKSIFAKMK
ncbi:MAG: HEAT repeat domain-containing protein [Gemmataceae bacterium]